MPQNPPHILAVIDLEGSGLRLTGERSPFDMGRVNAETHRPGIDHDCILEVGLQVLDASTLVVRHTQSWLVLPPGVTTVERFDVWSEKLKETNPFVFDMHSKPTLTRGGGDTQGLSERTGFDADTQEGVKGSLLGELRALAGSKNIPAGPIAWVEEQVLAVLKHWSGLPDQHKDAWRADHPGEPGTGPHLDWNKVHPGNSDIMFVGNSIANYDIPMLKFWMPDLLKTMSYRIMDVSVLRTFYQDLARVALPKGLAEAIQSGGGGGGGHRALGDAEFCTDALKQMVWFAKDSGLLHEEARQDRLPLPHSSEDAAARIAHLEMLVRYGSRRAIKEEREIIIARDAWRAPQPAAKKEDGQGLFRTEGGIFRKAVESEEADGVSPSNGSAR